MSRIGKKPIEIPKNSQVTIENNVLSAKGPKGELKVELPATISHTIEEGVLTFQRTSEEKKVRALHGLTRSLAANAIQGVSEGFEKKLEIEGVGFKAEVKSKRLILALGYSHPICIIPPAGIEFETPSATKITVRGADKQLVGEVTAKIRSLRKPEPYKGKGIRYEGEYIRRKAGKSAA